MGKQGFIILVHLPFLCSKFSIKINFQRIASAMRMCKDRLDPTSHAAFVIVTPTMPHAYSMLLSESQMDAGSC